MDQTEKSCCSEKTTLRSAEEKQKLLNRLARIEGQVRGLRGMIERDAYCTDILTQSAAVNAALDSFNRDLLARHIRTCVVRDLKEGKDGVVEELIETFGKLR